MKLLHVAMMNFTFRGDEAFYATANTLIVGKHKDSKEAIDRMVADLEKQYVSYLL